MDNECVTQFHRKFETRTYVLFCVFRRVPELRGKRPVLEYRIRLSTTERHSRDTHSLTHYVVICRAHWMSSCVRRIQPIDRDRPFCQIYLTGMRMPGFYSHGRASTQRLRTVTSGLCNDFSPPMLSEPYLYVGLIYPDFSLPEQQRRRLYSASSAWGGPATLRQLFLSKCSRPTQYTSTYVGGLWPFFILLKHPSMCHTLLKSWGPQDFNGARTEGQK